MDIDLEIKIIRYKILDIGFLPIPIGNNDIDLI